MIKTWMVCFGLEPSASELKAQTNPLSYGVRKNRKEAGIARLVVVDKYNPPTKIGVQVYYEVKILLILLVFLYDSFK